MMCRLMALSLKKKENMREMINNLLIYFGNTNTDGTGIAFIERSGIRLIKSRQTAIDFVLSRQNMNYFSNAMIGHVRAATTGKVSDENAHPFISEDKHIAFAHNGVINDYEDLKKELIERKHKFSSDVDSEVMLHVFEEERDNLVNFLMKKGVRGWANMLILEKDGTIHAYSDGSIYYAEQKEGVIVLQDDILKGLKKLGSGWMISIKDGRVIRKKKIGNFKSGYVSTTVTYSDSYGCGASLMSGGYYSSGSHSETLQKIPVLETQSSFISDRETDDIEDVLMSEFGLKYPNLSVTRRGNLLKIAIKEVTHEEAKEINSVLSCFRVIGESNHLYVKLFGTIKRKRFWRRIEVWKNNIGKKEED